MVVATSHGGSSSSASLPLLLLLTGTTVTTLGQVVNRMVSIICAVTPNPRGV